MLASPPPPASRLRRRLMKKAIRQAPLPARQRYHSASPPCDLRLPAAGKGMLGRQAVGTLKRMRKPPGPPEPPSSSAMSASSMGDFPFCWLRRDGILSFITKAMSTACAAKTPRRDARRREWRSMSTSMPMSGCSRCESCGSGGSGERCSRTRATGNVGSHRATDSRPLGTVWLDACRSTTEEATSSIPPHRRIWRPKQCRKNSSPT
mmetsp:Transcript_26637/g.63133  ORF Transcript_26637/g.63133 Transcript_26637/m.63133 type:complete len:207 (-) Transcript_26637:163-783(-)